MAQVLYKEKTLCYNISGQGQAIVFLHGYLETKELWDDYTAKLSQDFLVICPDLPGQGESKAHDDQSVETMASAIHFLLEELKIEKIYLFGHSMGGYVSLAFAELFSEKLYALGLLHSHPFSDSEEKKKQRAQEIDLVLKGKRELIIRNSIPHFFAAEFAANNPMQVNKSVELALKTTDEGMVACLLSMMNREDRLQILQEIKVPSLLIAGAKDELIPLAKAEETASQISGMKFSILMNSGHAGMLEEPEEMLKCIRNFIGS